MARLGAHVTISPTPLAAIAEAEALGITAIQLFTHNPRGWSFKPLDPAVMRAFCAEAEKKGIVPVVSHCNYLINLAATDVEQWGKSVRCLKQELEYAKEFGCTYFVLHVGKHKGAGLDAGIRQVIKGIHAAKAELRASGVTLLLETVAGMGTEVGVDLADLNRIIQGLSPDVRSQVGVCADTCHLFAAGYDLRTKAGVDATLQAIRSSFGIERLKMLHLNDAKGELGGHLDRHEHIGMGAIGNDGFREFLNRPEIKELPMILETPWDEERGYPEDLAAVRKLLR